LFEFGAIGNGKLDEPVGVAIGPDGNVYVADTWNMRVAISSPDGKSLSSFPVQGWNSSSIENKPYLAVNQDGQVLVTDPEGFRVLVFSPDGKPLFVFGTYGTEEFAFGLPNGIAISPDNTG
jgi:DNA-binding beta-propeller fold protein YncE